MADSSSTLAAPPSATPKREFSVLKASLKFRPTKGFQNILKSRIEAYFAERNLSPNDSPRLYVKAITIFIWLAASYAMLVFFEGNPWWLTLGLAISLAFAMAAAGFNIQHDGGHKAFSRSAFVNKLMALSLDLLGASSYFWDWKHNRLHHTYSNITGHDDDIELGVLGRLSPHQKHYRFHVFQHIYLWFLYGFITIKWVLVDDFIVWAKGKIGDYKVPRPKGWNLTFMLGAKALFFTLAFVLPAWQFGLPITLLLFFGISFVEGVILSVVFQLAHTVEEADFPMPDAATDRIENEWMIHQIETTVNFARRNPFINWYVGGLNFQVEHHLFPRISHIHYPAISRIVEQTCREFGVRYQSHETIWSSLRSHYRWLRRMGRPDAAPTPAEA